MTNQDLENILTSIRDVMNQAYHRAVPVCCKQGRYECCGSPVPEWTEFEEQVMDMLAPAEKFLSEFLEGVIL